MIVNFLNQSLGSKIVDYDYAQLAFLFSPPLPLDPGTTAQSLLGFPDGYLGTVTQSIIPVKLSGPRTVNIESNLSLHTGPVSGRICSVPITCNYGECLSYLDESGNIPTLIMDHQIYIIALHLLDENGDELECYNEIPWSVCIELQKI